MFIMREKRKRRVAALVVAAFHKHPNDSSAMLGARLKLASEYIRATLHRHQLSTAGRQGPGRRNNTTHRDDAHA
jgi:hypothetical protein